MNEHVSLRPLFRTLMLVGGMSLSGVVVAQTAVTTLVGPAAPVVTRNISESEVLAAQRAWGDALVQIAKDYESGGLKKAKSTAEAVIDAAYGYQFGPVLFKPTLTTKPQTFRTDRSGALSYFVGGNPAYPSDSGFALKGWRKVEISNAAIQLHGETAMSMGKVRMTDKDGKVTTVDKTWGYARDDKGTLRIVLHHSSLPYAN